MSTVLFLCPSLVGAGVERRVCILVNQMTQSGYSIFLGILRKEGQFINQVAKEKVRYIERPIWLKILLIPVSYLEHINNFFTAIYQIDRLIKEIQPEVVVTFTLETTVPAYWVKLFRKHDRVTWVISEDSNTPEAVKNAIKSRMVSKLVLKLFSHVYQKADYVTAVSNAVRNSLTTNYFLPENKVNVIPNPVDRQVILSYIETETEIPVQGDYLLAVGRLVEVKCYDLLLRTFALVSKQKTIKLIILGEGPEEARLKIIAQELGISKNVLFVGFTANPWRYMKYAKSLLLTSRQEGFSNVTVEAMIARCPVISTRCGGPEDIITQNINGILVNSDCLEIANEIIRLLDNEKKRQKIIKEAEIQALNYLPEIICAQFSSMLDRVIEDNRAKMQLSKVTI